MSTVRAMRPRGLATVAFGSALMGAVAVLLVAWAAGWLHGERRTVVLQETAPAAAASAPRVRPLLGGAFDPAAIYAERSAGVVTIFSVFGSGGSTTASQGSGFVVSPDGVILTNSHVITTAGEGDATARPADSVYVEFRDRDRVAARIVGWDVFDDVGVIGINAQIRSDSGNAEGVGFAVPINAARRSMEQLLATGRVAYAYVGVTSEDLTPGIARRFGYPVRYGAVITSVRPGSPGARAGLRGGSGERDFNGASFTYGGDVLVAVDGRPVRSASDVVRIVTSRLRPGQASTFTIFRDGERRSVRVVLDDRPQDPNGGR